MVNRNQRVIAFHSNLKSILAWRIPWIENAGGLQSMGLQRVGRDWATNTFTFLFFYLSYYTGKRQVIRVFRYCWRWTWTDRKITALRTSFLSTNQNGSLCGSIEEIWTQFIFVDNLLVPPNHYLAFLQILCI